MQANVIKLDKVHTQTTINPIITGTYVSVQSQTISNLTIENQCMSGCFYSDVAFNKVTFVNCNFQSSKFKDATFTDCEFINCTFSFTKIENCNFIGCTINQCNFLNTNFISTNYESCIFLNSQWQQSEIKDGSLNDCYMDIFSQESTGLDTYALALSLNKLSA